MIASAQPLRVGREDGAVEPPEPASVRACRDGWARAVRWYSDRTKGKEARMELSDASEVLEDVAVETGQLSRQDVEEAIRAVVRDEVSKAVHGSSLVGGGDDTPS